MKSGRRQLDVEELFRLKLENSEIIPDASVNEKIMRKLSHKEFLRFNPVKFNIYYLGLITAALLTAGIIILSDKKSEEKKSVNDQVHHETSGIIQAPIVNATQGNRSENKIVTNVTKRKAVASNIKTSSASETANLHGDKQENNVVPADVKSSVPEIVQLVQQLPSGKSLARSDLDPALFTPSETSGCAPLKIHFTSLGSYNEYAWSFGDGGSSDRKEPDWIFDEEGEYKVILTVSDSKNQKSSWFVMINVYPRPKAQFEISPSDATLPDEIRFINYSSGSARYLWNFGDGIGSTDFEPVHKYMKAGRYDVSLVALSENGCSDTILIKNAFSGSDYFIKMPNAFIIRPDGPSGGVYSAKSDEIAEIFHPVFSGVSDYQLKIFSKTGVLLFESNDINIGWDGYYKGQACNQGVYVWKVRGTFSNGEPFTKMGDVTLLRK